MNPKDYSAALEAENRRLFALLERASNDSTRDLTALADTRIELQQAQERIRELEASRTEAHGDIERLTRENKIYKEGARQAEHWLNQCQEQAEASASRIQILEKALKVLLQSNDLAAERGESIKNWPESYARKLAIAALHPEAQQKEGANG